MLPGLLLMNAAIIKHTTTSGPAVGSGLSGLAVSRASRFHCAEWRHTRGRQAEQPALGWECF
jgi:hypothetical protein